MSTLQVFAAEGEGTLAAATAALDAGELVVVPGDMRYFVVGDALDDAAVERLFDATQRGADRPLTVLLSGYADVHHVAYGSGSARAAAEARWPGPTILTMKPRPWVPDALTAGRDMLRVSAPGARVTRALAQHFGPLAAASARVQGQPDSLDAKTAAERLAGRIALAIDGGALPGGEEPLVAAQQG